MKDCKMVKLLFSLIIVVFVTTAGLYLYLQPNDLSSCKDTPDNLTENCKMADAVVAVSGGDTDARTDKAIGLFKKGWAKKIIFSGAAADKSGPSNAKVMKTRALKKGIDEKDILIDEYSENTTENAQNTSRILEQNDINSIILVTSGYHQRRAGLEFKQKSPNVEVRNAPVLTDKNWGVFWWASPFNWWLAVSESFKILLFYVSGGLV